MTSPPKLDALTPPTVTGGSAAYAEALDEARLWVEMFTDDASTVISRENADKNLPVGLIYRQ
jgi:hypothetical protein